MTSASQAVRRNLHHVLVALDARGNADHALRTGAWLANAGGGRLSVVHAVGTTSWSWMDDPRDSASRAGLVEQAWRAAVRHVTTVIGNQVPGAASVEEAVHVEPGRPAEVVLEEARRRDADVIVVGFDAERPRIDFGGTARRLIAGAPKAVWVQKREFAPVKRILVPVDLSKDSLLALATARDLARVVGARLEVLHAFSRSGYVVSTWPDYPDMGALVAIDELRDDERAEFVRRVGELDRQGVEVETRFVEGDPAHAIVDAAGGHDLIVMGTHGRTGLAGVLLGSVTWSVLRKASVPVLAVRHPKRAVLHRGTRESA
jgi:nucleotide-binding universal stress UspA family protein